jgi:hypothetical protein
MDDSDLLSPQGGAVHMPPHKPLLPKRQMRSEERETHPPGDLLTQLLLMAQVTFQ